MGAFVLPPRPSRAPCPFQGRYEGCRCSSRRFIATARTRSAIGKVSSPAWTMSSRIRANASSAERMERVSCGLSVSLTSKPRRARPEPRGDPTWRRYGDPRRSTHRARLARPLGRPFLRWQSARSQRFILSLLQGLRTILPNSGRAGPPDCLNTLPTRRDLNDGDHGILHLQSQV